MSSTVLADKDINSKLAAPQDEKEKPKSMEYHRRVLQSKIEEGQYDSQARGSATTITSDRTNRAQQIYVSPSDNIQSPATQKLNAFKNKHAMKKSKPQTLFAKASTKKIDAAGGTEMFGEIPKANSK
ncbi:hypothetical protein M501DRAFT_1001019 [Patellaria atrata CBS 101060]|uniref:Spo12-like protein n=1 Tax=Patellaria atrata CBS 101060 TaxID=1346257 RepID=A0A9P4VS69_9PEZI|nr:hypothetical protein M501DRAFT_1001019 [Patellaria atrata CBS 101060]